MNKTTSIINQCKECINHARTWEETQDGKYPASDHSPACSQYKPIEHYKVQIIEDRCALGSFICTPEMLNDISKDEEIKVINTIMLTEDQYNKLEEWQGP